MQDNPFADSTLYELNTTYVPPDLSETVDAVVPAVPAAGATLAPSSQPAAAAFTARAVTPPAVAGPAVPAAGGTVPALPFTGVHSPSKADAWTGISTNQASRAYATLLNLSNILLNVSMGLPFCFFVQSQP
jgi:hypothetical protein